MMDVGMTTNDSKTSKGTTEPSMIRIHTPSPVSRAYPGDLSVPGSTPAITDLDAIDYDSGNDTEPEDSSSNAQSSLGAFKSFLTYHTAASSLNSSPLNTNPPNTIPSIPFLNASNLRRSISADRLTMRPTPPPLIRTQSDSPSVHSAPSSSIPTLASLHNPLHSLSSLTLPGVRVSGNDGGADINTLLNAFCGDHVYISQPNGPIYTENVETKTLAELVNAPGACIPTEDMPRLTAQEKGKGRADDNLDHIYDSDAYLSATSDSEPTSGTSPHQPCYPQLSDTTDDEFRYGTVPDYISDSEDIDISAYINTTATMPAFPAPTVSRSRSSSRSCPNHLFTGDIPPVPPIPAHALLGGQPRTLSAPRLASSPVLYSPVQDNRALQTPTPTQTLPPTPSSASISSTTSLSSTAALNPRLKPPAPPSNEKSRQRSVSESGGGSGSGSGSGSRGRFARIAQVLRKSPSVSPGRGIEHIAPPLARKSKNRPKFTIAFIGSAGCGKTSIIENASYSANPKFKQETTKRTVCYNGEDIHIQLREVATVVDKSRSTTPVTAVETDSAPFLRALDGNAEFWPDSLPAIDAVVLCYDASREGNQGGSFDGIQRLNDAFAARRTPIIWVGCKSDWIRVPNKDNQGPGSPRILPDGIVPPNEVFVKALASHTGLIEVTQESSYGIEQMRNSFTWMYKSAARLLRDREQSSTGDGCLNHASPEVLDRKSSQKSTRSRPIVPRNRPPIPHPPFQPSSSANPPTNTPHSPTMLQPHSRPVTRARSMSDLLSQEARDRVAEPSAAIVRKASATMTAHISRSTEETRNDQPEEEPETKAEDGAGTRTSEHNISVLVLPPKFRQDKYAFMTVDDMIVRLSGGMVPGWDIQFNQNFMMTFRRFATPREILVGMVLRLRTTTDEEEKRRAVLILFDYLLEWTFKYPQDFATPGAIAPFISLIGLFKNKFLHEGAPRLEERLDYLSTCTDDAADWAKVDAEFTEGEDSDTEDTESRTHSAEVSRNSPIASIKVSVSTSVAVTPTPEPSSSKVAESSAGPSTSSGLLPKSFLRRNSVEPSQPVVPEQDLRDLRKLAKGLPALNPKHVAEEITREDVAIFLALQPRDWLRHGYTTRRERDTAVHPLDRASSRFERLGLLVASTIIVLGKVRHRALVFEFWILVASHLRGFNNFAALHTVIAAMDKVYAGSDGPDIQRYVQAGAVNWNRFLSMRVLILKSNGSAYKTALKHTSLPLIPTMAIHTSDVVRVMSNRDSKEGNPKLIHWGKFQILARIATEMEGLQGRIHRTTTLDFQPHPEIAQMLRDARPLPEEFIDERTYPPLEELPPPNPASVWSARVIRTVLK